MPDTPSASSVPLSPDRPLVARVPGPGKLSLTPEEAWQPLPAAQWDAAAARHLLRRIGWTARPSEVTRVMQDGLAASLDRLFPAKANPFPAPQSLASLDEQMAGMRAQRAAPAAGAARPAAQQVLNQDFRQAEQDLAVRWLDFAVRPENTVTEKWTLFLSDIYVVSQEKVRNPQLVYAHHALLRAGGLGPAPALTKAVSRSPAMVQYLDLGQSQRDAPNENFARELFELFLLGEGNYTERDIKAAARAFTGYRQGQGEFFFARPQHDPTAKTIFGRTGNFDGDDVINLAYTLPAAGAFVPHELARFYLTDDPLPQRHLAALGDWWRTAGGYDLRRLAQRFFSSRLFFDPAFRGNYIKSPVQFLLGLTQDLELDLVPIPRRTVNPLRTMGQIPFRPPNVRGWVGGRNWINSSTLAARRQAVEIAFAPLNEASFNADEIAVLNEARAQGRGHFTFTGEHLAGLSALPPDRQAAELTADFLPVPVDDAARAAIRDFLAPDTPANSASPGGPPQPAARPGPVVRPGRAGRAGRAGAPNATATADTRLLNRLSNALVTILQSPEYQLC